MLGVLLPIGTAAMALMAAERADKVVGRHDMRRSALARWLEPNQAGVPLVASKSGRSPVESKLHAV